MPMKCQLVFLSRIPGTFWSTTLQIADTLPRFLPHTTFKLAVNILHFELMRVWRGPLERFWFQTPTKWVSTDYPVSQRSWFGILSWLRTLRVCGGPFVFFVPNPYNVGVYILPWTQAVIMTFWASLGPQGHWGGWEGPFVSFVKNPYNMGVYGLPWTQAITILHFELTWNPKDTERVNSEQ